MVSDLRELMSIWSDKWRDREGECEAERAWGAIMEMDIHDWRAARGAEGNFGCLEIACDTQNANAYAVQRSVVALERADKEGKASTKVPWRSEGILRGCFQKARKAMSQPPNHPHVWL
jgi:hypothetical protein